jgi:uncharacterized protein (TIGR00255 family)
MTGFGAAELELGELKASVSVRSLNHRFLELAVSTPRRLAALEPRLKALVQERVQRGKVELTLRATLPQTSAAEVVVARGLAAAAITAMRSIQHEHGLNGELRAVDVMRFPGVIEVVESTAVADEGTQQQLIDLAGRALESLDAMRRIEGETLARELTRLLDVIAAAADNIERLSEESRGERRTALLERVRALATELGLDDGRLYQEVVRQAERSDVAEELQRLRSHVSQARELLAATQAAGKRLDFLTQELMREANTIGSKAAAASMLREVVELKSVVERVREQVQNVE